MRNRWAARVSAVVAVVALPLGMFSIWAGAYVGNTDRYLGTVAVLAEDPAVKKAAVDYLERETMAVLNASDQLGTTISTLDLSCIGVDSALIDGLADLANTFLNGTALGNTIREQIEPQVRATVHQGIVQAVESDAFAQVWVQANRQAHREVLAALEDKPAPASSATAILIPLRAISEMVTGLLPCPDLITPATAEQIQSSLTLVNADDLRRAHPGYQALTALRWVFPVLFVLGAIGALVLSPTRRRTGWQLALGFALGMGALAVFLAVIRSVITSPGIDQAIFDALWAALTRPLKLSMAAVAAISILAALGLWLSDRAGPGSGRDDALG